MVFNCVVYQCFNRQNDAAKERGLSFFRFPKNKRKRKCWVRAINRAGWMPNEFSRICSDHFLEGWHSDDPNDENYGPTIFSYKVAEPSESDCQRHNRLSKRNLQKEFNEEAKREKEREEMHKSFSLENAVSYCMQPPSSTCNEDLDHDEEDLVPIDDVDIQTFADIGQQCDPDPLQIKCDRMEKELEKTKSDLQQQKWAVEKIKDNDTATKFYTGIPTFAIFLWIFNYLHPKAENMTYWRGNEAACTDRQRSTTRTLRLIDQLFAVLLRIRLGLFVQDVSDRFQISTSYFSKYFTTWLCLLHTELKELNPFPSRSTIDKNMPESFKSKYPRTRVIIDCTELYIQRSSSIVNQSETFSNYKHHTTVKFLVGITPNGVISFVSDAWGGRVSDRNITIQSGILDLLDEGDSIMADKGFTITDVVREKKCFLNIPPFRGIKEQFSTEEVFETQDIARLRIHVERAIGRVKNFHILNGTLPLSLAPHVSKIFQVACWLSNFDCPLIK